MLNYIVLKSNEAFTEWQNNNPGVTINNISPIMQNIEMKTQSRSDFEIDHSEGIIDLSVGVFVLYTTEKDT